MDDDLVSPHTGRGAVDTATPKTTSPTPPDPHATTVDLYDHRTGRWTPGDPATLADGDEAYAVGVLFRMTHGRLTVVGDATRAALHDADAAVTEISDPRDPGANDWVLVLRTDQPPLHERIHTLTPGDRFAFQGRVFEALGGRRVERIRETGEVIGRVVNTFERPADTVIDVRIGYPDGTVDTLTGTPNHPFWVPAVNDYVALEDLEVGTVLRTYGGSEATVLGLAWKPGEVEVYDIEVEGLHNFFVRGPGSDAPGVLVHNSTGGRSVGAMWDGSRASVDDKLGRYLLNADHPVGGSKAKWFKEALGFDQSNAVRLADQIQFDRASAVLTRTSEHGTHFNQVINITGANGRSIDVTFAWIQRTGEDYARLVTAIPTAR